MLFQQYRYPIQEYLRDFLTGKARTLSQINRWGKDLMERLMWFSSQGKMIRGGLVVFSYNIFRDNTPIWIFKIASALELIHSSLLIHDDIMDRDSLRRGKKSIFFQYKELLHKLNPAESYHAGESLGICAGDIGFFLGFEILSNLNIDPFLKDRIFTLWTEELTNVGLAQMEDIYFSIYEGNVSEEDILNLYRFKTARYTFSLPMSTGAMLGGCEKKSLGILDQLGEICGLIFQIKDDELGLFGKEKELGKSIGTDITERKKTLHLFYLLKMLKPQDKRILEEVLNGSDISEEKVKEVIDIVKNSGVQIKINEKLSNLKSEALSLIEELDVKKEHKKILKQILRYNLERKK